jgi:Fe-S cluster assembly ATP-binding protein
MQWRKYRQQPALDRFDFAGFIKEKFLLLDMPADLMTRLVNVDFLQ